jgi:hypothetical protein
MLSKTNVTMAQDQYKYAESGNMNDSTVKQLLDTDNLVARIKQYFGLERKQEDGEEPVWVETENSLMNKKGVEMFLASMRTMVDRNQIASNFQEGQIMNLMQRYHDSVAEELYMEWNNYGIKNKGQARKVMALGTNVVWATLLRAEDGKTIDAFSDISKDKSMTVAGRDGKKSISEKMGLG